MIGPAGTHTTSARRLFGPLTLGLALGMVGCGGTSGDEGTVDLVGSREAAKHSPNLDQKTKKLGGSLSPPYGHDVRKAAR